MFKRNRSFPALILMASFLLAAVALAADYKYVAPKRVNKYHYPNCEYAQRADSRLLLQFYSAKEAQAAGYAPCPRCKPPITD